VRELTENQPEVAHCLGAEKPAHVLPQALALYFVTFAIYVVSPVRVHSDTIWSIPTAISLLDRGTAALDAYRPTIAQQSYGIYEINGHAYYYYPLGPSLVAVPLLWIFDRGSEIVELVGDHIPMLRGRGTQWRADLHRVGLVDLDNYIAVEGVIAAFLVSGAVTFIFITARLYSSGSVATLIALIFAFGTTAYSTASRLLWQHTPSILAIAAIVFLLARPTRSAVSILLCGAIAGAAYIVRPTNSITVVMLSVYFLLLSPKKLAIFATGVLAILIPFAVYNFHLYSALVPPYFQPTRQLNLGVGRIAEAFAGNLISPSRGLFVYSPVLLLAVYFCYKKLRRGAGTLDWCLAIIVLLHLVIVASVPNWWAGHSFGPRFATDLLPYFVYFVTSTAGDVWVLKKQGTWRTALAFLAVFSCFVHFRGATAPGPWHWNDIPVNVDKAPGRVWDWKDPQFLRALRAKSSEPCVPGSIGEAAVRRSE
jgi:hypothetical protein